MKRAKKITVIGAGYVGMPLAALLSEYNEVTMLEIDQAKVSLINKGCSTVKDAGIEDFLRTKSLSLHATTSAKRALSTCDFILIAIPTDFDTSTNQFNTDGIEQIIQKVKQYNNSDGLVVIKSTVPIGFTESMKDKYDYEHIIFSPEFLRENRALNDNLYPSRIIIGGISNEAKEFSTILLRVSKDPNTPVLFMGSSEAEAVKLFSNTYLAMRVAYFNELDSFAMQGGFDSKKIIEGVSYDPRIGQYYNNPSFGYGGYCLPKDTLQLRSNYHSTPQNLIHAIIESNNTRKDFIIESIAQCKPRVIGAYKLAMKQGSNNFRSSSILDVIKGLNSRGFEIIIYEPNVLGSTHLDFKVYKNLDSFKSKADIIIANRIDLEILDIEEKVFSRDIFTID